MEQEGQRAGFLERSLEAAKEEWTKLANENSVLKSRVQQLEQIASSGSKFAKFVSLKEENQKLSHQHARLRKAHVRLKKQTQKGFRGYHAQPAPPRRPFTTQPNRGPESLS